jgi:hypothetical protein
MQESLVTVVMSSSNREDVTSKTDGDGRRNGTPSRGLEDIRFTRGKCLDIQTAITSEVW